MSQHPVAAVVRARAEAGSRPGARADGHRVALVLEGGGMRGVVSAGMAGAIERLGLTDAFDLVVGASAGALNGAALLAGVAQGSAAAYHGFMASRQFVDPARLALGRPAIDVAFILDHATNGLDAGRHERTIASPISFHCVALEIESAKLRVFTGMRTREALWEALLATSRMPWVGGPPVEADGRRYLDGGLTAPIPVEQAIAAGATHVLVLQTRPIGVPRSSGSRLADRLIERHLRRLNPTLVRLYRERVPDYERIVDAIARRSADPTEGPPFVLGLRPPAGTPVVRQLERRAPVLREAAADAARLAEATLS